MAHSREYINNQILKHYATANIEDLARKLGITVANLRVKARRLGVSRQFSSDLVNSSFKYCPHCQLTLPLSAFNKDKYQKRTGYDYYCRSCRNIKKMNKVRGYEKIEQKEQVPIEPRNLAFNVDKKPNPVIITPDGEKLLKCKNCQIEKPLDEYHKDSRNKSGRKNFCKSCLKLKRLQKI